MEGQQQKIQPEGGSTRKMTDKSFYWKFENLAKDFTATIAQWRKQANEIQVLLSDSKDTQEIRNGLNMLMDIMSRHEATYSTIDAHFTDSNGKAADGTRTLEKFQGKYEKRYFLSAGLGIWLCIQKFQQNIEKSFISYF